MLRPIATIIVVIRVIKIKIVIEEVIVEIEIHFKLVNY